MTNLSAPLSVDDWNASIVQKYIWVTVLLVIFLVIGVVGNSMVILIYKFKMKGKIDDRFFIPVLAGIDLISCVLLTSLSLIRTALPVMFKDAFSCKTLNFSAHSSSCASLFMLLVIAIHRYQKICRPSGYQMDEKGRLISICSAIGLSVILFSPLFSFYEIIPVHSQYDSVNITGFTCSTTGALLTRTRSLIAYQLITFLVYILTIIAMSVFYVQVSRAILQRLMIHKHKKSRQKEKHNKANVSTNTNKNVRNTLNASLSYTCDTLQLKRHGHLSVYRYSYIFMVITIKAVISYIGPWAIIIYESTHSGGDVTSMDLLILKRLYILSHVTNPFIYGLLDRKFRTEFRAMFCGLRRHIYRVSASGVS